MRVAPTAFGIVFFALTSVAIAGPLIFAPQRLGAAPWLRTEAVEYRCHGEYRWVPDGTIAGETAGYPYYGWYGYPYLPFRCLRFHRHVYRYRDRPHP